MKVSLLGSLFIPNLSLNILVLSIESAIPYQGSMHRNGAIELDSL